jgi:aspartate-semialdehyde dehydrogenase
MSRRSASRAGTARVAVVGSGAEGALVREALAERGVEGKRVDLYGVTRGEAILSEYDGEARLIQEPEPSEVGGHEVVFLCEPGAASERLLSLAGPGSVVVDLVGCGGASRSVFHSELRPPSRQETTRPLRVPHSISIVLAQVLRPLDTAYGIESATAVVLRPAGDFGEQGIDELREQTVRILRFERAPVETFGRQLAFNVLPQPLVPGPGDALERTIEDEIAELLRWDGKRLGLKLATVPVFYGHSIALRLRLRSEASLDDVAAAVAVPPKRPSAVAKAGPATPMEAAAEPGTIVSHASGDGASGFWLWVVAGDVGAASARAAVGLAASLADL